MNVIRDPFLSRSPSRNDPLFAKGISSEGGISVLDLTQAIINIYSVSCLRNNVYFLAEVCSVFAY